MACLKIALIQELAYTTSSSMSGGHALKHSRKLKATGKARPWTSLGVEGPCFAKQSVVPGRFHLTNLIRLQYKSVSLKREPYNLNFFAFL